MAVALSVPQVSVNGNAIEIKPNSLSYISGKGEAKTRVASGGGARVSIYSTQDVTTMFSTIKFIMFTTDENIDLVETWKDRFDSNTVSFTEKGVNKTQNNALIMNDPDFAIGVEGEVEVTFTGRPLI